MLQSGMPESGVIRRFPSAAAAREALLVGRGLLAVDPGALPKSVRESIHQTFGEDIGAEEVVRRVIDDVRNRGDSALRHFTRQFDVRHLIFSHRYVIRFVHQDVSRLQQRISQKSVGTKIFFFDIVALLLVTRHPFQPTQRRNH